MLRSQNSTLKKSKKNVLDLRRWATVDACFVMNVVPDDLIF